MTRKDLPYKNKGDLTTGSIPRHLLRLTVPMIWGIFAVISVQLADTYFIGFLGTRELAAISFTFPVTMLITHLLFGVSIAMTSVVSRLMGGKKTADAKRVTLHGLMLGFSLMACVSLGFFIFLEPLFRSLGAGADILPLVTEYMSLWLLGVIFLSIPMNGNSAIRATGSAILPALIMTTGSLVNLILDPIFIFGLFGAPAMGIKGAALATVIGYLCALSLGLYVIVFVKKLVPGDGLHMDKFKDSMKRLSVIAIPAGITNIIQPLTQTVIVATIAHHGAEAVAAFGIAGRVEAFAMLIVIALATGMAPIIGQNWGAHNFDRVHKTINLALGFNLFWSFTVAIILGLTARHVADAFTDDQAVIDVATLFFWIVPFSHGFGNLVFGWASAFNAMGMPQRSFVMIVVKSLVLTLPAVIIGSRLFDIPGIFVGIAAANVTAGILFHIISWRVCLAREHAEENE